MLTRLNHPGAPALSLNRKMEKFQDCTRWQRFPLSGKNLPLNSGNKCQHLSFYHFGVTLSCWRSVLQKKEYLAIFCKILSLPLAFPPLGPLAVWSSGWPRCVGITLGFSGSAVICQLLNIWDARSFPWSGLQNHLWKEGQKIEISMTPDFWTDLGVLRRRLAPGGPMRLKVVTLIASACLRNSPQEVMFCADLRQQRRGGNKPLSFSLLAGAPASIPIQSFPLCREFQVLMCL